MQVTFKKYIFVAVSIISLLGYGYFAFATINPGDTLDPVVDNPADCPNGPTDPTCVVTLTGGTVTADNGLTVTGANVQFGGTLTENTTIDQDGNDFIQTDTRTFSVSGSPVPVRFDSISGSYNNPFSNTVDRVQGFSAQLDLDTIVPGYIVDTFMGVIPYDSDNLLTPTMIKSDPETLQSIILGKDGPVLRSENLSGSGYFSELGLGDAGEIYLDVSNTITFSFPGGYYSFPTTAGSANQVLTTDGFGTLSWGSSAALSPISIGTSGTTLYSSGLAGTGEGDTVDGNNIFLGVDAGSGATSANYSNFFGPSAGFGATSANYSNFFGPSAGYEATEAQNSNFFGEAAGLQAISAWSSNFFGQQTGGSAINARNSNFFGNAAGYEATNAPFSNFIGYAAGYEATNAPFSNFIGYAAGSNAVTANNAIFIGYNSGYSDTVDNTTKINYSSASGPFTVGETVTSLPGGGIGYVVADSGSVLSLNPVGVNTSFDPGDTITGASSSSTATVDSVIANNTSILIGDETSTDGFSNSIAIGAYATNTASNQFMIGSATRPIDEVVIVGNGASCAIDNNIYGDGTTGINCSSDERLKTNITEIGSVLDTLGNVQAVNFNWKANPDGNINIGFIAQNLEQYYPELVRTGHDGYLQVNYAGITPILVKAIQELNLKIDTLQLATPGSETPAPLFAAVSDWLGDTANGIIEIIADTVRARNQLCIDDVCMTKDQLRTLLENNGMETENESEDTSSSTPDDETIPEESSDESGIESEPIESTPEPEIITEPAPTESGDSGVPA